MIPHPSQMAVVPGWQPSWVQPETQAVQENSVIPEPPLFKKKQSLSLHFECVVFNS
jgi:hypothetical protein